MRTLFAFIVVLGIALPASAKLITKQVDYKDGDVTLKGYLAFDDALKGKRPGVLVVHEWWGLNDHARKQAERLAALGYVAFALDMYGDGMATDDPHKAGEMAGQFRKDKKMLAARARAGLDVLLKDANVDPKRIAAIGYCFGGSTVLQLALSGADLAGVVSFHGGLGGIDYQPGTKVNAKILVLHGADDPLIPADSIKEFQDTLRKAGADWEMNYYGNALHSFTNEKADAVGMKGVAYHKPTADRSWAAMRQFLGEIFGTRKDDHTSAWPPRGPAVAVWNGPIYLLNEPASLQFAAWRDGRVILRKAGELLCGAAPAESVEELISAAVSAGWFTLSQDMVLAPDGPETCMLLSTETQTRVLRCSPDLLSRDLSKWTAAAPTRDSVARLQSAANAVRTGINQLKVCDLQPIDAAADVGYPLPQLLSDGRRIEP